MSIYISVCVCVCVCVCKRAHARTHTHTPTHIYARGRAYGVNNNIPRLFTLKRVGIMKVKVRIHINRNHTRPALHPRPVTLHDPHCGLPSVAVPFNAFRGALLAQHQLQRVAYVSIRQHTSAYVS